MDKIVYAHIPKTGGTSLRNILKKHYKIKEDYRKSINQEFDEKNYDLIVGHFNPSKYQKLYEDNWKFITWLREPAQRLYSLYYHYIRHKNEYVICKNNLIEMNLNNKNKTAYEVIKNNMTLDEFIFSEVKKNDYKYFFSNFKIENFFFVGITENYENDLKVLSKKLNKNFDIIYNNTNPNKKLLFYEIENSFLMEIKKKYNEDYEIYNRALEISNKRGYLL